VHVFLQLLLRVLQPKKRREKGERRGEKRESSEKEERKKEEPARAFFVYLKKFPRSFPSLLLVSLSFSYQEMLSLVRYIFVDHFMFCIWRKVRVINLVIYC
jgi:hypothetical protein